MEMFSLLASLFQGTSFDVYIHWLIFILGICILVSGVAVLASCRNIAGFFHLLKKDSQGGGGFYRGFYKYHSLYWYVFWFAVVLHLLITIPHLGLPKEPYYTAQMVSFITSITNSVFVFIVLLSCRSFVSFLNIFKTKNPLDDKTYRRFYRLHRYFLWLLGISVTVHIVFGLIHAVNT